MREILAHSIPFLVLGAMALGVYYVARRLSWAFSFNFWLTLIITALLVVSSFVIMVFIMRSNYTGGMSHLLSNFANITLGVMMFLVCIMLLVDLAQIFLKLNPKTFGYTVVVLTMLTTLYSLWNAQHIRVVHKDIELPNLQQPLTIALLTDIHLGHYWGERAITKIVNKLEHEKLDAIVITGDMFDGVARLNAEVLQPLKRINLPIYFVEGNHDVYSGQSNIKSLLRANGVTVLENERVDFEGLQIVGLDYLLPDKKSADTFHGAMGELTMEGVLPTLNIDKNRASLLLHHNPVGAEYAAQNGINLYLAGHTHAGQLFPATLFANMMFEFNRGLYQYTPDMQVYVSQGTGTFGPPMRLGTHSEVTIIKLTDKK